MLQIPHCVWTATSCFLLLGTTLEYASDLYYWDFNISTFATYNEKLSSYGGLDIIVNKYFVMLTLSYPANCLNGLNTNFKSVILTKFVRSLWSFVLNIPSQMLYGIKWFVPQSLAILINITKQTTKFSWIKHTLLVYMIFSHFRSLSFVSISLLPPYNNINTFTPL